MRKRAFIATAAALVPSLASAASPIHLAPSTPWVVNYAENSCRLIRHFGQGKDETILAFESEAPGSLDMLIVSERLSTFDDEVPVKFVPVQSKPMKGRVGKTTDKAVPTVLISKLSLLPDEAAVADEQRDAERRAHPGTRPPPISLAEQAMEKAQRQAFAMNTTAIEVDPRRDHAVILDTGSLGAPIKAFDQCLRDSLREWGVDPDIEDKIVRPVWAPRPSAWFSSNDYPQNLVRLGEESVVKVRVLVDATGRVTKCTSLSHFEEAAFNRITCANFSARAHFEPAELADGTKVPSYYVNNIVFRIER